MKKVIVYLILIFGFTNINAQEVGEYKIVEVVHAKIVGKRAITLNRGSFVIGNHLAVYEKDGFAVIFHVEYDKDIAVLKETSASTSTKRIYTLDDNGDFYSLRVITGFFSDEIMFDYNIKHGNERRAVNVKATK